MKPLSRNTHRIPLINPITLAFNWVRHYGFSLLEFGVFAFFLLLAFPLTFLGNVPLNDDWIYTQSLATLLNDGSFPLSQWGKAWAFPQILVGVLFSKGFGFSQLLLHRLTLLWAICGIWGFRTLLGQLGIEKYLRLSCIVTLISFPPFFINCQSFMTDVPFNSLWIWSLCFFVKWQKTQNLKALILGVGCTFLTMLQRQSGAALLGGLVIYYVFRQTSPKNRLKLFVCLSTPLVIGLLWLFFQTNSEHQYPLYLKPMTLVIKRFYQSMTYLSLPLMAAMGISPLVSNFKKFKLSQTRTWLFLTILAAVLFVYCLYLGFHGEWMPYFGNNFSRFGVFRSWEVLAGDRPILIPRWLQFIFSLISAGAFLFILPTFLQNRPHSKPDSSLILIGVSTLFFLIPQMMFLGELYDRYLITVLVGLICIAASKLKNYPIDFKSVIPLHLSILFFSYTMTLDYLRWNDARWQAGLWTLAQGIPGREIEGGLEWSGKYKTLKSPPYYFFTKANIGTWEYLFKEQSQEIRLSFSPLLGYEIWNSFPYKSFWNPINYDSRIFVLRRRS